MRKRTHAQVAHVPGVADSTCNPPVAVRNAQQEGQEQVRGDADGAQADDHGASAAVCCNAAAAVCCYFACQVVVWDYMRIDFFKALLGQPRILPECANWDSLRQCSYERMKPS